MSALRISSLVVAWVLLVFACLAMAGSWYTISFTGSGMTVSYSYTLKELADESDSEQLKFIDAAFACSCVALASAVLGACANTAGFFLSEKRKIGFTLGAVFSLLVAVTSIVAFGIFANNMKPYMSDSSKYGWGFGLQFLVFLFGIGNTVLSILAARDKS